MATPILYLFKGAILNINSKQKIDLAIVTSEPFPIGMAATNRMLTYATELSKKKNVLVLIARPTEVNGRINNLEAEGEFKKVKYKYVHGKTIWLKESSKFKKLLLILDSYILLFKNIKKNKPNSVLLVSNRITYIWALWLYSKILRFKYYQEKSEKPPVMKNKTNYLFKNFYLASYKLFDGIIVMTNELAKLFYATGQTNTFHLPMTVDMNRFKDLVSKKDREKATNLLFKYSGGGNLERDGMLGIVQAFIALRAKKIPFEFHIIGPVNTNDSYYIEIASLIEKNSAQNDIFFKGQYPSTEIPQLISEADCLIMAPAKDFASGGFPTKLGEYLSTGLPVICTSVSEIPMYLDKSCAIIIPPNDVDAILKSLMDVIENYPEYIAIGEKGKAIAEKNFSAEAYSEQLINFLEI